MLYDPNWEVKTKADPFTLTSLIGWLEKQPLNKSYGYFNLRHCVMAEYFRAQGYRWVLMGGGEFNHGFLWILRKRLPDTFIKIAVRWPRTYGAALERAREFAAGDG